VWDVTSAERVLLVGGDILRLFELRGALDGCPAQIVMTPSVESAKGLLYRCRFAVVAIDIEALGDATAVAGVLRRDGFPPEIGVLYVVDDVEAKPHSSDIGDTDFVTRAFVRDRVMRRLASAHQALAERAHGAQQANGLPPRMVDGGVVDGGGVLREPLNLEDAATVLERLGDKLESREREMIKGVIGIVRHASHLMDSMAQFIQVAVADAPLLSMVDCNSILREVVDELKAEIEATSAQVIWPPLPALVTDRRALHRVFASLIGNALKYRSGSPPAVIVDASFDGAQWTFSVADNGVGVHPANHDLIFAPFAPGSRGTPGGAGLGLTMNRMELEILGGRIWVEARESGGSVFRFTLPAGPPSIEDGAGNGAH
jgi:signal transduction histidine kinase